MTNNSNGHMPDNIIEFLPPETETPDQEIARLKAQLEAAKAATLAEPVQAKVPQPTPQEREQACMEELNAVLNKHQCRLVPTWVQISETQQVRSQGVTVQAVVNP